MFEILRILEIPGWVIVLAFGYFVGSLFRNVGLIKIIAIFILVPPTFQLMIQINELWWVTVPLLVGIVIGYWGFELARQRVLLVFDIARDWVGRFR